ncbi:unnamed protein product [Effrenium voratum]|nr:unnamed protein product [Effrenium voratum]
MTAKVSLLRGFADITEEGEWTPGTHGLWYSDGSQAQLVYLPQAAEKIAQSSSDDDIVQRLLKIIEKRADGFDEEEEEEDLQLPAGHMLYKFETVQGACPISTLPLLQTRRITDDHIQQLLIIKERIKREDRGKSSSSEVPRFALLSDSKKSTVRAMVVPTEGAYGSFESAFDEELRKNPPAGLKEVRRIFVLSPVWDCFIDGCGLPEQRCAWYGNIPLDIPLLEQLRTSKAFQIVTLDQDQRERCVEALLPFVRSCIEDQHFTLVPIMVGSLMSEKAEQYVSLLAPFMTDPENLFIVGGDVETLGETFDWPRLSDLSGGPQRFMIEAPKFVNREDKVVPIFSALELFLSVLAMSEKREDFLLTRYW